MKARDLRQKPQKHQDRRKTAETCKRKTCKRETGKRTERKTGERKTGKSSQNRSRSLQIRKKSKILKREHLYSFAMYLVPWILEKLRSLQNTIQHDGCLEVDFEGEDMGILIGKRGQTLDSLQYLTSLVVNKGKSDYIRVKLDTEDYRRRRKETLENLARGIAYKVKKTRKPVVLEPMNPYERRIIHSALQGNKFVETVSEGEEPYRHVVVKLKRY